MRLAVIAGDGIGPEVVAEGLKVLRRGGCPTSRPPTTTSAPRAGTAPVSCCPTRVIEELRGHDAILLGAVGDPSVPPGVLERGLLLRLRFELDHHVNLRPVRLFAGVTSPLGRQPGPIDMVVRPRGHRGALRRAPAARCARTPRTRWPPRSQPEHRVRRRAGRPGRVRAGHGPAAQAPDAGPQDQRAHPRRRRCGRARSRRSPRSSPRSPSPTSTSTRPRCSSSPTRPGSTWSSPTTSSATSSPTSAPRSPAASGWPPAATST